MEVEILSVDKRIYKSKARAVTLPAEEGEVQILDDHASFFTLLGKGEIRVGKGKRFPVVSGVAEILNNKIIVLCSGTKDSSSL